jgi:hypothetical protein
MGLYSKRVEVLTAVNIKIVVFLDVIPHKLKTGLSGISGTERL